MSIANLTIAVLGLLMVNDKNGTPQSQMIGSAVFGVGLHRIASTEIGKE
jgi:hypothetical protein